MDYQVKQIAIEQINIIYQQVTITD